MFVNEKILINIIIVIYVNDLLICNEFIKIINNILKYLQIKFKITDLNKIVNCLKMKIDVIINNNIIIY